MKRLTLRVEDRLALPMYGKIYSDPTDTAVAGYQSTIDFPIGKCNSDLHSQRHLFIRSSKSSRATDRNTRRNCVSANRW